MPEVGGGSLSQCCRWLSPVTQTKLTKVHFETRELVLAFVTGYKRWSQGNLTYWNSKLEAVKTISTRRKINAILLNIKINQPKLVDMCGPYTSNKSTKFHGNILSLSENIANKF